MGLRRALSRLFGGNQPGPDDSGLYYYVRLQRGGEIVRLRLDPRYDLTPDYDSGGYVARKTVTGPRTYRRAEVQFRFDSTRRLVGWDAEGGELAPESDWIAQQSVGPDRQEPAGD
jgi:hypothetical protein